MYEGSRVRFTTLGSSVRVLVVGLILALAAGLITGQAAQASPSEDIARVQAQVRDLQGVAEGATERYNEARSNLGTIMRELRALRLTASRQSARQQETAGLVDGLARAAYMSGSLDASLQLMLAEDPAQFLANGAALEQLAQSQQRILRLWHTASLRLKQTQAQVMQRTDAARRLTAQMASAKATADQNLSRAQSVLSQLSEEQRKRLERLRMQKRREAIAAAAAAKQQLASATRPSKSSVAQPSRKPARAPQGYVGSSKAATAVRFALSQVGKRYVAAQDGLQTYDCSGLTLAAWRQAGVGLTHYSRSQYAQTRRVPVSQIRPGDLVFYFGSGAHHVAIYVGNGKMVSASNPDDGVELIDFLGPWYRERFSGVGRVL